MSKIKKINHFITMRWTKNIMEEPPKGCAGCTKRNLIEYQKIQLKLLYQLSKQIKIIYPFAKLHVITNENHDNIDNLIYHKFDFESNHLGKTYMYGLLDEPCLYMDADILMISPLLEEDLKDDQPFYFFHSTSGGNIEENIKKPLPIKINKIYNAGVVWIPKPSKNITKNIFDIHKTYFYDETSTDEHASTLYYDINKMTINSNKKINVPRMNISAENIIEQKIIHYTGYDIKWKKLCLLEYKKQFLKINSVIL